MGIWPLGGFPFGGFGVSGGPTPPPTPPPVQAMGPSMLGAMPTTMEGRGVAGMLGAMSDVMEGRPRP